MSELQIENLWFDTPTGPVRTTDIPDSLWKAFLVQAPLWPTAHQGPCDAVRIHIDQYREDPEEAAWAFAFESPTYDAPRFDFPSGLVAGNGLIGCLIHTFVAASDNWFAFHAGAIETDEGLTVLLGDMMAGKSTLTAALTEKGHRLWCDDRLPVFRHEGGFEGISLGLRPKLRSPLPPNAPATFLAFVQQRAGAGEGDMRYLELKNGEAAGFDQRLPIRRIVVLDRQQSSGDPEMFRLPLGEAVKRLASCTFAPHLGPVGLLERLRTVVEASECLVLRYSDSFTAARWASDRWGRG